MSGEALAQKLGISRVAVWKRIVRLRAQGYRIDGARRLGYRYVGDEDRIDPAAFGGRVTALAVTTSTQDVARRAAQMGAPGDSLYMAERQAAGRGRLGRAWSSGPGGLWFTLLIRPRLVPAEASLLTLAAGVAVAEALAPHVPGIGLKWPNDVVVGVGRSRRKLAGILVEMQAEADAVSWVAVGVGVNVANRLPLSLRGIAVTLSDVCGDSRPGRAALLHHLLERLRIRLAEAETSAGREAVCRAARALSVLDGSRVTVRGPGHSQRGVVEGIRDDGALLLRLPDGVLEPVLAGDVVLRTTASATFRAGRVVG